MHYFSGDPQSETLFQLQVTSEFRNFKIACLESY